VNARCVRNVTTEEYKSCKQEREREITKIEKKKERKKERKKDGRNKIQKFESIPRPMNSSLEMMCGLVPID
jgi:hypothetical protein